MTPAHVLFIILKPLFTVLADRHDWKHRLDDKNDHDLRAFKDDSHPWLHGGVEKDAE